MKSRQTLLWLAAIGFFMETLDSTIVNTALPAMAHSLVQSPIKMQSVVIAYSMALAIFIPVSGWLADHFGTRKVFLSAIAVFSVGSLMCALSHDLTQLTVSRVIQGLGGSMLMPIGRLAVLHAFPGESFLKAISFVTLPALIGPLVGPILGGWLVEYSSWHWIFLINLPIGIVGCITTYYHMPDTRRVLSSRFDLGGFILLALTMVSMSFGLNGLSDLNFSGVTAVIFIIFGLSCFCAYWLKAAQTEDSIFSTRIFKIPTFRIGLLGNMFSRIGSAGMPFLLPLYLQVGLAYSSLRAGLILIPVAIAAIFAKSFASPLIRRIGYRKFLIANTFFLGIGIASFFFVSKAELNSFGFLQLFGFGFVNSLQFTAMNSLTLKDLPPDSASSGNTLFSMVQMLALSFSVALCSIVVKALLNFFHTSQDPTEILTAFRGAFLCMGAITCCSVVIFMQLSSDSKGLKGVVIFKID